jgi:hypothetical protein
LVIDIVVNYIAVVSKKEKENVTTHTTMEMEPKSAASTSSSDQVVPETIRDGFEKIIANGATGFVLGGMAGIVLARGGASNIRKVMAGFGAGAGMGSAWTRTSMDIEDFMSPFKKK